MCVPSNPGCHLWHDHLKKRQQIPTGRQRSTNGWGCDKFFLRPLPRSDEFGSLNQICIEAGKKVQLGVVCTAGLKNALLKQVMQLVELKSPRSSTNNNKQAFHIHGDFQPEYFTDFQADSLSHDAPAKVAKIEKKE